MLIGLPDPISKLDRGGYTTLPYVHNAKSERLQYVIKRPYDETNLLAFKDDLSAFDLS